MFVVFDSCDFEFFVGCWLIVGLMFVVLLLWCLWLLLLLDLFSLGFIILLAV